MEIFDTLNAYLHSHPALLAQMAFLFRIKAWILFGLMFYFIILVYRAEKKEKAEIADKDDNFLA